MKAFTQNRFIKKSSVENLIGELDYFKGNTSIQNNKKMTRSPSTFLDSSSIQQSPFRDSKYNLNNSPTKTISPKKTNSQPNVLGSILPNNGKGMFSYPKPSSFLFYFKVPKITSFHTRKFL